MKRKRDSIVVLLSALLLTALFHKQALGLNLLVAEFGILAWLIASRQYKMKGLYPLSLGAMVVITGISTVINFSAFAYIIHFLTLFVFIGVLTYPETRSVQHALLHSLSNLALSQGNFLRQISNSKVKGRKLGSSIWRLRIFIIPILVVILFIIIYRNSNPIFDELVQKTGKYISEKLNALFKDFDFLLLLSFFLCILFSVLVFFRKTSPGIIDLDRNSQIDLIRRRRKKSGRRRITALKNEYRAGIFLLLVLNAMILLLNIVDIRWVWFGFEWEGQYLKEFVHEGTYLLIISIIISIVVVLYFFRGNLNFYSKNKLLKILSYSWLAQNMVLALSVAIRNALYIQYFALAYKRIGVYIFLALVLFGIVTVLFKLSKKKSAYYLFRTNAYILLLVLMISSCVNWDRLIAKYNFDHADRSFVHMDYLSTLSDKALPYLDISQAGLHEISKIQDENFPFGRDYMSAEEYYNKIQLRKMDFKEKWESKGILSWNLPEYRAYQELFDSSGP